MADFLFNTIPYHLQAQQHGPLCRSSGAGERRGFSPTKISFSSLAYIKRFADPSWVPGPGNLSRLPPLLMVLIIRARLHQDPSLRHAFLWSPKDFWFFLLAYGINHYYHQNFLVYKILQIPNRIFINMTEKTSSPQISFLHNFKHSVKSDDQMIIKGNCNIKWIQNIMGKKCCLVRLAFCSIALETLR